VLFLLHAGDHTTSPASKELETDLQLNALSLVHSVSFVGQSHRVARAREFLERGSRES
jgi:hypothetical protein